MQSGTAVELIDVRTPVESREVQVGFARNVPLDQLDALQYAAGLLVLIGFVPGAFVNPYWIGLAAFVGAGHTFARVTEPVAWERCSLGCRGTSG